MRFDVINRMIKKYNFKSYLEIGVRRPNDNFNKIICENKTGVDPDPNANAAYVMTSDEFFKQNKDLKFDIIFIDGMHEAHQVYKDIKNGLAHLNPKGVIILHDCNPPCAERAIDFEDWNGKDAWNGDCWKAFVKYRFESQYECYVVNDDTGCGIIDTNNSSKANKKFYSIGEFTYKDLEKNRNQLLDLRKD